MLAYRDRTFCAAPCAWTSCQHALTEDVLAAADRWWGKPGAPISMADLSPNCANYTPIVPAPLAPDLDR